MFTETTKTTEPCATVTIKSERFYALMKLAGQLIDPATAEVTWIYAQTFDPYGIHPDLPEDWEQIGREHFARNPGSDVWVSFGDLPEATRDALWEKYGARLASFVVKNGRWHWNIEPIGKTS
jgi:hypothetical protein